MNVGLLIILVLLVLSFLGIPIYIALGISIGAFGSILSMRRFLQA